MKKIILMICVCAIIAVPLMAAAQTTTNPCSPAGVKATVDKDSTLPICINRIYQWSLGIGALLALLMTVLGGYYYMTSGGNAEQAAKGQEMIWGAIIGLVLLFAAYLILRTINPDLVNFKVDTSGLKGTNSTQPQTQTPSAVRQGECPGTYTVTVENGVESIICD